MKLAHSDKSILLALLPIAGLLTLVGLLVVDGLCHLSQVHILQPMPAYPCKLQAQADAVRWRLTVRSQLQASLIRDGNCLRIEVHSPFPHGSYIQCLRHGVAFQPGATYTLHFRARTTQPRHILAGVEWSFAEQDLSRDNKAEQKEWLGIEWRTYALTFVAQKGYGTASFTLGRLPGIIEVADIAIEAGRPEALRTLGWLLQDHLFLLPLTVLACFGPIYCVRRQLNRFDARAAMLGLGVIITAGEYLVWRTKTLHDADMVTALPLFAAELLGIVYTLGLQYTVWPRKNMLTSSAAAFHSPPIYVLIPTVNEDETVLEPTLRGALAMRESFLAIYPDVNVTVALCNDGRVANVAGWQETEALVQRLGLVCITRETPGGAKAGNIEMARQQLGATGKALLAIFDADQVPADNFLLRTVPFFADPSVGWVQTPQWYRNRENPIARWADEQQALFYGAICQGKSALNAACICGTNVVIRAEALDSIGGLPQDSVTEDTAASLRLHPSWRGLYLPERLAEGLGPVDMAGYLAQQRRWATGMLEILFRSGAGAIWGVRSGLRPAQRIQYLLSCSHYLSGLRDIIVFSAPIIFLLTGGRAPVHGADITGLIWHFVPFFSLSLLSLENAARVSGSSRSFLSLLRTTALGFGAFPVYLRSLWTATTGQRITFTVTPKRVRAAHGTTKLLLPQIVVFLLGVAALLAGLKSLLHASLLTDPLPVILSCVWVSYNLMLLSGFFLVALRTRRFARSAVPQAPDLGHPLEARRSTANNYNMYRGIIAATVALIAVVVGCRYSASASHKENLPILRVGTGAMPSPLQRWNLYADSHSTAAVWWRENRLEYPAQAEVLRRMSQIPTAFWLTDADPTAKQASELTAYVSNASYAGHLPVVVLYAIVGRDEGGYSRGGANSAAVYRRLVVWLDRTLGKVPITLIIEPDALAYLPGLNQPAREEREALLSYAVTLLSRGLNRFTYLDAGHAGWLSAQTTADLLRQCGVGKARGFSLNISNYRTVNESVVYASEITRRLGGTKAAVIDTSRCGNGPASDSTWCNPPGRALGPEPTTRTTFPVDALLWIKRPWESDGTVNGAPSAGNLHLSYALELARNAGWR